MTTQQSRADISRSAGSTLPRAPSSNQVGIRFSPEVAFAVTCNPGETKAADKPCEGRSRSLNGTRCLADDIRFSASAAPDNARALSHS
jgi:hypothetical protein